MPVIFNLTLTNSTHLQISQGIVDLPEDKLLKLEEILKIELSLLNSIGQHYLCNKITKLIFEIIIPIQMENAEQLLLNQSKSKKTLANKEAFEAVKRVLECHVFVSGHEFFPLMLELERRSKQHNIIVHYPQISEGRYIGFYPPM
jgi:hypothetical protein